MLDEGSLMFCNVFSRLYIVSGMGRETEKKQASVQVSTYVCCTSDMRPVIAIFPDFWPELHQQVPDERRSHDEMKR